MLKRALCSYLLALLCFLPLLPAQTVTYPFIVNGQDLIPYKNRKDVLLVASSGRSGSTMLTHILEQYASQYVVLKTHMLPPEEGYIGKIIFIYSNPNKCAESMLHQIFTNPDFLPVHFINMESSDLSWLSRITHNQTRKLNVLTYDAFGIHKQLIQWLHQKTTPDSRPPQGAQILALKYENLWDPNTIQTIKEFLNLQEFELPPRIERGYTLEEQDPREIDFIQTHNKGTPEHPRYAAYDPATEIWRNAPPIQLLKLKKNRNR